MKNEEIIGISQKFVDYSVQSMRERNIPLENKKFIQKVGRVDLGSLNWTYYTGGQTPVFLAAKSQIADWNIGSEIGGLSALYDPMKDFWMSAGNDMKQWVSTSNVNISNSNYTTAAAFKTAMSGVYLYYELATPVETDISSYIEDGFLNVKDADTIELTNTYNQDAPYTITYYLEV